VRYADSAVVAFDNLKRRGSELALRTLAAGGGEFPHGDICNAEVSPIPAVSICSSNAQPSPQLKPGFMGKRYIINTGLMAQSVRLAAMRAPRRRGPGFQRRVGNI
jgi:CDP-paratose 2-epimerase